MINLKDDSVEQHVVLECEKYERDRMEMMQVILTELGRSWEERVEKTGREWMVLLLGLCRETNERMIEAVKEFLKDSLRRIPSREFYLGGKIMAPQWPLTEAKR